MEIKEIICLDDMTLTINGKKLDLEEMYTISQNFEAMKLAKSFLCHRFASNDYEAMSQAKQVLALVEDKGYTREAAIDEVVVKKKTAMKYAIVAYKLGSHKSTVIEKFRTLEQAEEARNKYDRLSASLSDSYFDRTSYKVIEL